MTRHMQSCSADHLRHLDLVAQQRDHYKSSTAAASATVPDNLKFGDNADAAVIQHLSFDLAQQIFIPNSSQQVGPLYFLDFQPLIGNLTKQGDVMKPGSQEATVEERRLGKGAV